MSSWAGCAAAAPIDRANGLPEGVFAAVKGFSYGWMDLSGRWLYAESIFASSNDEMDNGFF